MIPKCPSSLNLCADSSVSVHSGDFESTCGSGIIDGHQGDKVLDQDKELELSPQWGCASPVAWSWQNRFGAYLDLPAWNWEETLWDLVSGVFPEKRENGNWYSFFHSSLSISFTLSLTYK